LKKNDSTDAAQAEQACLEKKVRLRIDSREKTDLRMKVNSEFNLS